MEEKEIPAELKDCVIKDTHGIPYKIDQSLAADWLKYNLHIKNLLPESTMLMYNSGVYVEMGEQLARSLLEDAFGKMLNYKDNPILNKRVKAEIIEKLKDRTYIEQYITLSPVEIPTFDTDLNVVNMENGLYNWRTGEFTPHNPDYLSRIQIAVQYNPSADFPHIREILQDILNPKDYAKFIEFLGYCIYRGYDIQKALILFGPASSGKSVLMDLIINMLGSWNCTTVTMQNLGGKTADRYSTAKLYGKLANVAGDLDNTEIPEIGIFKMLTSGKDRINARFPYGQPFDFKNFAKLVMSANELPCVNDRSNGFYRRIEIIQCLRKFKPGEVDADRLKYISDPTELSGLFNAAMAVLPDLLERRDFTNAITVDDAKELYRRASDPVEIFCVDCIDTNFGHDYISKEALYETYVRYCEKYKLAYLDNAIAFGRAFKKVMGWSSGTTSWEKRKVYNGAEKNCWVGFRVKFTGD